MTPFVEAARQLMRGLVWGSSLLPEVSHDGRRLAEDGCVPHRYSLIELSTRDYPTRTLWNIAKSDGTLVFVSSLKEAGPGSRLTIATALKVRKPCRTIELEQGLEAAVRRVRGWFRLCGTVKTVNVAGSRESTTPGIEVAVRDLLVEVLQ